jgi:DNA gyrase/topoisomerase IV subunit B
MDPTRRTLLKVTIPPEERLETDRVMSELMGKDPAPRFNFIMSSASQVEALDV